MNAKKAHPLWSCFDANSETLCYPEFSSGHISNFHFEIEVVDGI